MCPVDVALVHGREASEHPGFGLVDRGLKPQNAASQFPLLLTQGGGLGWGASEASGVGHTSP